MTGLIATGCRPTGAPLVTAPTVVATTTTTTGAQLPTVRPSTTTQPPGEEAAVVFDEVAPPAADLDLTELDYLLKDLDEVFATLQDTMDEGEDQ